MGYKESKEILIKNIKAFVKPLRDRRKEIEKQHSQILSLVEVGTRRAQKRAREKMKKVREAVGISF